MTPQEFDNKYKNCLICEAPLTREDYLSKSIKTGLWQSLHNRKVALVAESSNFRCSKNGVHFSCCISHNAITSIVIILDNANIIVSPNLEKVVITMKLKDIKNKKYELACGPIERWLNNKDYLMGKIEKLSVLM